MPSRVESSRAAQTGEEEEEEKEGLADFVQCMKTDTGHRLIGSTTFLRTGRIPQYRYVYRFCECPEEQLLGFACRLYHDYARACADFVLVDHSA